MQLDLAWLNSNRNEQRKPLLFVPEPPAPSEPSEPPRAVLQPLQPLQPLQFLPVAKTEALIRNGEVVAREPPFRGRPRVVGQAGVRSRATRPAALTLSAFGNRAGGALGCIVCVGILLLGFFAFTIARPDWFLGDDAVASSAGLFNLGSAATFGAAPSPPPSPPPHPLPPRPPPRPPPAPRPPPSPSPPPPTPSPPPPPPNVPGIIVRECDDAAFWFANLDLSGQTAPTSVTCANLQAQYTNVQCSSVFRMRTELRLYAVGVTPLVACCFCNGQFTYTFTPPPALPPPPSLPPLPPPPLSPPQPHNPPPIPSPPLQPCKRPRIGACTSFGLRARRCTRTHTSKPTRVKSSTV